MKKINLWYFLFLIPVFVIILSWFSTGKIISNNSEENLNIINAKKSAEYYSTSWNPIGTGLVTPLLIVRYPAFLLLSYFQGLEFSPFLTQALFLGIIMLVGILAMYLLINKGFEMVWQVSLIGSIFYLLNLYSMTQIWKRFLYNGMISWAYLPLFLFLWIKSFTSNSLKWPILFLLTSPIFSYTFSHPSYFFTFWIPAGIFLIFQIYYLKLKKSDIFRTIFKSLLIFFLWILINIWWIYPLFKAGESYMIENIPQWQANFDSLLGVSKYFGTFDILLLRQKNYFEKDSPLSTEWFGFYNNPLVFIISIAILFCMFLGVIRSKGQRYWAFLTSLLVIGWFISKGSNFPLGYTFFYFLFNVFPATGALRNPYEKFGIVYLLAYSIFFAFGLYFIIKHFKSKWRYVFAGFMMTVFCGILVYPVWNGDIFPPKHRLTIPSYYFETNNFVKSGSQGRIFHIPFTTEIEKISYNWGYIGEDPSENLFDLETLTEAGVPLFNNIYKLMPTYLAEHKFPKVLGLIGAEFVILHKDMTYPKVDLETITKIIDRWEGVNKEKEFGELIVYSVNKDLVKQRIYTVTSWTRVENLEEGLKKVISEEIDTETHVFTLDNLTINKNLSSNSPTIDFEKKSNAQYLVKITNATSPFILVFNNTFDKLWQATIYGEPITDHFIVNGFANGWLIDKKGTFELEISLKIWPWD